MLVEDDLIILHNIKLLLELNGFEVFTGRDGLEALEMLQNMSDPPALILSDIVMPVMNGYEFFSAVSNQLKYRDIPFIFLTARSSPEEVRFAKLLGVDDYLTKPFREEDLFSVIKERVERRAFHQGIVTAIEDEFTAELQTSDLVPVAGIFQSSNSRTLVFQASKESGSATVDTVIYPADHSHHTGLRKLVTTVFTAFEKLCVHEPGYSNQGITIRSKMLSIDTSVYYDRTSSGNKNVLAGVMAAKINYLEALRAMDVVRELTRSVITGQTVQLEHFWEKIEHDIII